MIQRLRLVASNKMKSFELAIFLNEMIDISFLSKDMNFVQVFINFEPHKK